MKGWGFCFKFFSPFSPVWPAADSFSFSPAFNASWVELWNKHQEVKKQKSLEKTSKEIKKRRNWLLQPPHNCQLPTCRVSLHLWHTVFMPARTKVYQESLHYRGDPTDQFALGKLCSNGSSFFFFFLLFFPPPNVAFFKEGEADILHPHHIRNIYGRILRYSISFLKSQRPVLLTKSLTWIYWLIDWMLLEWRILCSFKPWDGKFCYLASAMNSSWPQSVCNKKYIWGGERRCMWRIVFSDGC